MAKRKSRTVKRTSRPARAGRKKTSGPKKASGGKRAAAATRERRRRERETLSLRSFEPTFTVNDIERSVRFYSDVLGFIVIEQMSDGAKLQGVLLKAGVCKLGLSVGRPNALRTAMIPRVDSETGVFSTNRTCQMASACSRLESFQ